MTTAAQLAIAVAAEIRSLRIDEARESALDLPELPKTRAEIVAAVGLAAALNVISSKSGTAPVARILIRLLAAAR